MFNYKAATNLVGFFNGLKVVAIVLSLLAGIGGGVSYAAADKFGVIGMLLLVLGVVTGVFWATVSWAVLGYFQHSLAAVSHTAFLAGERAKLGV